MIAQDNKLNRFLISDSMNKPLQGDTLSDAFPGISDKGSFHDYDCLI
jgi:hypothetical protein